MDFGEKTFSVKNLSVKKLSVKKISVKYPQTKNPDATLTPRLSVFGAGLWYIFGLVLTTRKPENRGLRFRFGAQKLSP